MLLQHGATGGSLIFDGWPSVLRIVASAAAIYVVVVVALRIAGQRALAKMSGYDLIVTVALGSLVANIATGDDLSVADGAAAIVTFLLLQEVTSWLQARSLKVHHLVRQRPQVLLWDGQFLPDRMEEASVTEDELRAAIRRAGMLSVSQAQCVVLENDGEWSVIARSDAADLSALDGLEIPYLLPPGADPATWRDANRRGAPGEQRGEGAREPTPSSGLL